MCVAGGTGVCCWEAHGEGFFCEHLGLQRNKNAFILASWANLFFLSKFLWHSWPSTIEGNYRFLMQTVLVPTDAITNNHKLSGLTSTYLLSDNSGDQKTKTDLITLKRRCWLCGVPLAGSLLVFPSFQRATGVAWLVTPYNSNFCCCIMPHLFLRLTLLSLFYKNSHHYVGPLGKSKIVPPPQDP